MASETHASTATRVHLPEYNLKCFWCTLRASKLTEIDSCIMRRVRSGASNSSAAQHGQCVSWDFV